MREMKDSGIEWIGMIPIEWTVCRFKNIANIYNGNSIKDEDKEKYEDANDAIPYIATKDVDVTFQTIAYDNGMYVKKDDTGFKRAPKNSTLLCIEGGSAGKKIAFTNQEVCFINKLCCFYSESICNKFLFYYMLSPAFAVEFNNHLSGLIGGVSISEIKDFSIVLPKNEEQQKIASFLDRKCAEIDATIEKTKATIEEYKKLKQSVITEAVTKGIRGERPMKDSGIEWIGEIPADWNIKVAFQMFKQVKRKNEGLVEQNLLSLSYGKIKRRNIDAVGGLLPESFDGYNIIEKDDIVLRLTDLQNDQTSLRVGLANERGIVTSAYLTLRNQSANTPLYLYYYLHSFDLCKGFYGMGAGVRQGLNWDGLKLLKFALPSVEEQMEITEYLEKKCSEIDALIEKKTALLAEMETYKKSVIYEYVTGKKDITTESEQTVTVVYPYFPAVLTTNKARFAQAILMSKILDSNVSYMGRVKLEKMLFTIEHSLGFDFDTEYHREAAGPLDSSIYECEKIISRNTKWFYVNSSSYGVSYKPQKDMSNYKKYYERYFSDYNEEIERIIAVFKNYSLEKAEIIATLYGAWNDFIIDKKQFTDEDIVIEVLTNWNDSKKRFSKEVWLRAIESMRKNNIVPKGYGKHTIIKEVD